MIIDVFYKLFYKFFLKLVLSSKQQFLCQMSYLVEQILRAEIVSFLELATYKFLGKLGSVPFVS